MKKQREKEEREGGSGTRKIEIGKGRRGRRKRGERGGYCGHQSLPSPLSPFSIPPSLPSSSLSLHLPLLTHPQQCSPQDNLLSLQNAWEEVQQKGVEEEEEEKEKEEGSRKEGEGEWLSPDKIRFFVRSSKPLKPLFQGFLSCPKATFIAIIEVDDDDQTYLVVFQNGN